MKHADVLVIDDEQKFAGMLAKRLELRGLECDVCYDGMSGVEWVRKSPDGVSLVLLDLNLPDIYGTQVMVEIKKINPLLPVVIVTGHGSEADKIECMKLGAVDFKNKPLKIETVMALLNRIKESERV